MKMIPQKRSRFKGIRLPAGYESILREDLEQSNRDPEDQNQPEIPNQLKKFGGTNPSD